MVNIIRTALIGSWFNVCHYAHYLYLYCLLDSTILHKTATLPIIPCVFQSDDTIRCQLIVLSSRWLLLTGWWTIHIKPKLFIDRFIDHRSAWENGNTTKSDDYKTMNYPSWVVILKVWIQDLPMLRETSCF